MTPQELQEKAHSDGSITVRRDTATWIRDIIGLMVVIGLGFTYADSKPSKSEVREMIANQTQLMYQPIFGDMKSDMRLLNARLDAIDKKQDKILSQRK